LGIKNIGISMIKIVGEMINDIFWLIKIVGKMIKEMLINLERGKSTSITLEVPKIKF
jgi:hypothetical protein